MGVISAMSACEAAKRYGTVEWARATTGGCACGGRGVIEGPLTRNHRPSKSM